MNSDVIDDPKTWDLESSVILEHGRIEEKEKTKRTATEREREREGEGGKIEKEKKGNRQFRLRRIFCLSAPPPSS